MTQVNEQERAQSSFPAKGQQLEPEETAGQGRLAHRTRLDELGM